MFAKQLLAGLTLLAIAVGSKADDPPKPTALPPKAEAEVKRNATVERVKLVGIGGLLEQDAVRSELSLTKEQVEKINLAKEVLEEQLKAVNDAFKLAMSNGPMEVADMIRHSEAVTGVMLEFDGVIQKHLANDQLYRLKQLQLQCDGPSALLSRYALRELTLSPEQEDKLAEILKPLTNPKVADYSTVIAVAPEEPRIAKYITVRAEELNTLREEALKVLSKDQQAKWKEMTGDLLPTPCLLVSTPQGFMMRQVYMLAK